MKPRRRKRTVLFLPEVWYAMTSKQLDVVRDEEGRARGLVERTVDKPFIVEEDDASS